MVGRFYRRHQKQRPRRTRRGLPLMGFGIANGGLPAAAATTTAAATATAAATTAATASAAATTTATTIAIAASAATTTVATTAAGSTTAATAAAATTTATATATRSLLRLIDVERAAVEHGTVHLLHRLLSVGFAAEGNETEAAAATRITVIDDLGVLDRAELLKSGSESLIIGVPAEAAHKKLLRHVFLSRCQSGTEHDATVRDWRTNG
jgi:hypothetical protein